MDFINYPLHRFLIFRGERNDSSRICLQQQILGRSFREKPLKTRMAPQDDACAAGSRMQCPQLIVEKIDTASSVPPARNSLNAFHRYELSFHRTRFANVGNSI